MMSFSEQLPCLLILMGWVEGIPARCKGRQISVGSGIAIHVTGWVKLCSSCLHAGPTGS